MEVGLGHRTADEGVLVPEAYHELIWLAGA